MDHCFKCNKVATHFFLDDYVDPNTLTMAAIPDDGLNPDLMSWKMALVHGNCWPVCDNHLDCVPESATEANQDEYEMFNELGVEDIMHG